MTQNMPKTICAVAMLAALLTLPAYADEFYALAGAVERKSGIVPAAFLAGAAYAAALRTVPKGLFGRYGRQLQALGCAGALYIISAAVNAIGFSGRMAEGLAIAGGVALGEFGLRFLQAAAQTARTIEGDASNPARRRQRLQVLTAWQALQWLVGGGWLLGSLIAPALGASLFVVTQGIYAGVGVALALRMRALQVPSAEKLAVAWVPSIAGGAATALTYVDDRWLLLPAVLAGAAAIAYYAHCLREVNPSDPVIDAERHAPVLSDAPESVVPATVMSTPVLSAPAISASVISTAMASAPLNAAPIGSAPQVVEKVTDIVAARAPIVLYLLREGTFVLSHGAAECLLLPAPGLYRSAAEWTAAMPPAEAERVCAALADFTSPSCLTPSVEFRMLDAERDSAFRHYRLHGVRIRTEQPHLLLALQEITHEVAERETQLRRSGDDAVSGLAGRAIFFARAHEAARQFRAGTTLLYKLQNLSTVYRVAGKRCGDFVVRRAATRLLEHVGPDDVCGRVADDVLAVFFAATNPQTLRQIERHLKRSVSYGSREIFIAMASATVALPEDPALYDASVWIADAFTPPPSFNDSGNDSAIEPDPLTLPAEAATALQDGRLSVFYQPIVRPLDGKIVGAEALLRWRHPRYGLLLPGAFRDAAEAAGVMGLFSRYVLAAAAEKAAAWRRLLREKGDARGETFFISVNVLREQPEESLVGDVTALIAAVPLPRGMLKLEIAENAWPLSEAALAALEECRRAGASVWLDDFGTQSAGFAALLGLPLDGIKLDRSLIVQAAHDARARQLLRGLLQTARDLGLDTTAEGVTDPMLGERLAMLGCTYMQGEAFAMPIDDEAFAQLLLPAQTFESVVA